MTRDVEGRTASTQSGSSITVSGLREAREAYLDAINIHGPDSAEALAARFFLAEVSRLRRPRRGF